MALSCLITGQLPTDAMKTISFRRQIEKAGEFIFIWSGLKVLHFANLLLFFFYWGSACVLFATGKRKFQIVEPRWFRELFLSRRLSVAFIAFTRISMMCCFIYDNSLKYKYFAGLIKIQRILNTIMKHNTAFSLIAIKNNVRKIFN